MQLKIESTNMVIKLTALNVLITLEKALIGLADTLYMRQSVHRFFSRYVIQESVQYAF